MIEQIEFTMLSCALSQHITRFSVYRLKNYLLVYTSISSSKLKDDITTIYGKRGSYFLAVLHRCFLVWLFSVWCWCCTVHESRDVAPVLPPAVQASVSLRASLSIWLITKTHSHSFLIQYKKKQKEKHHHIQSPSLIIFKRCAKGPTKQTRCTAASKHRQPNLCEMGFI